MGEVEPSECCTVESVVTVDERGQMVLPKDVRDKMDIKPGTKLAVVAVRGSGDRMCCITLIKAETLSGPVKSILSPLLGTCDRKTRAGRREHEIEQGPQGRA
jgi:AbrB family looped-hinge helix DNA binding protein